jgi:hypothetical protein
MRELFVWYRVDDRNADALRAEVEAMQRSLEQRFAGLQARLLIRREADRQTWMETFARAPRTSGDAGGGVDSAIEAALAAAALALRPLLASDRHAEAFEIVRSAEGR